MSHQKRRARSPKKQLTEKQLLLVQRSRSIKASLLRVLSIDIAALYHTNHQPGDNNPSELRQVNRDAQDASTINPANRVVEQQNTVNRETENRHRSLHSEPPEKLLLESEPQQNASRGRDELQREPLIMLLIFRLFAFFIGLLVHHAVRSYFFNQSVLLLGIAIAMSSLSILVTVIFMPWNRKLLWNLFSLFGGLLFAVIML